MLYPLLNVTACKHYTRQILHVRIINTYESHPQDRNKTEVKGVRLTITKHRTC